jgi:hypothetical protein
LDDQLSSVTINANVFNHVPGMVLELGGGRNNVFTNNIINGSGTVHFDNRGGDGSGCASGSRLPFAFLGRVPYQSATWAKYPNMSDLLADAPCTPKYNVIEG